MVSQANKVDSRRLRKLYGSSPAAREILDHLASRGRSWRTTSVERILASVRESDEDLSRGEVIDVFKALEECGCGQFKAGRKGWPSRFEWAVQMVSAGRVAAGETEQVEDLTAEDLAEEEPQAALRHTYRLRPDASVTLDLPRDLTASEAERLAQYIRTLPFEPVPPPAQVAAPPAREPAASSAGRRSASSETPDVRSGRASRIGYATSSRATPSRGR